MSLCKALPIKVLCRFLREAFNEVPRYHSEFTYFCVAAMASIAHGAFAKIMPAHMVVKTQSDTAREL